MRRPNAVRCNRLLGLYEREEISVALVLACVAQAVRAALINLQDGIGDEFRGEHRGVCDRHDLVVVAVDDERRHIELLQVFGEIRFRERLDAVIRVLVPSHHALQPPRLDQPLGNLGAGAVEAKEWATCHIEEELRAVGQERSAKAVEDLDG